MPPGLTRGPAFGPGPGLSAAAGQAEGGVVVWPDEDRGATRR